MRRVTVLVLAIGASACGGKKSNPAAEENKRCADAIADGRITEARAWLAAPDTLGFEVEKSTMRDVADAFYSAGATQVRAAWDELDGKQVCALFVVELPATKPARAATFEAYGKLGEQLELEPIRDVGQTCLLVPFD